MADVDYDELDQPPVNAPPVDPSYSDLGNMMAGANSQPPVRSGASAPPLAPPVSQPPVSMQPAPSMPTAPPVSTPNLRSDVMAGNVAPPVSADYKPVIPSSKSTWLNRLAAGMVGFKNPQAGVAIRQRFEQEPITRANEAYQRDTGEYNTAFNQGITQQNEARAGANEARQEKLTAAQVAKDEAETANLKNPQAKQGLTPEETTIHDLMTGNNGQPRIDPNTQKPYDYLSAYTAVQQAKQDVKPEKNEKPNTIEMGNRTYQWDAQGKKWKDIGAAKATNEPGSYMPVPDPTDPIHKIVGWVDPKSGHYRPLESVTGMAGNNEIKPTGQAASREEQASVIGRAGDGLIKTIESNRDKLGNVSAILESAFLGTPLADPAQAGLATEIASFAALNPAMHGFRGTDALNEFKRIIGGIPNNPDALISSIKAIQKTAGYFNPNQQPTAATGGGVPTFAEWQASQKNKKQ
jgi:hypothetical protein